MNERPWPNPIGEDTLADDAVHVWLADLRIPPSNIPSLQAMLADDEKVRASRFRFEPLQNVFIVSHGILRLLLSRYLNCDPASLRFQHNSHGKPELPGHELRFNFSHSGDYTIYALVRRHQIGIDIERMRPLDDLETIARYYFSEVECAALLNLRPEEQVQGFFNGWTRKEAYIKAIGKGLAQPLDAFDVTLAPDSPARLLRVEGDLAAPQRWSLWDVPAPAGYAAACMVECPTCELQLRTFTL
ncbi:MAG: 4'-phosphopantetheinyl transferase superfamily protein [Anaerolineae bacterium]|nr:4'-phosphopantetheinyl transferase superfamily protein [Anaerolineae bacterium]